jgi:D-amino-acid dehydrogenase
VLGREVVALAPGAPALVKLAPASPHPSGPATRGAAATASRLPAPHSSFSAASSFSTLGPRSVDEADEGVVGDVLECDAIVVCANLGARALLAPLGLNLPVAALPGTSVTVALHAHEAHRDPGPTGSVFDARTGIAICRQGARVRLAGGFDATAGGRAPTGEEAAQALYQSLDRWFPGAARWPSAQVWQGERATLPDGLPLIGASKRPGLFLNLAHGHHGWGVACGAAQALAALVSGREPPLDLAAFAPARLG